MAGQYELGDLGGVLGADLYNSLFGSQGFSGYDGGASGGGGGDNPWMSELGWNQDGNINWGVTPNEDAMSVFDDFRFNWNPTGMQAGTLTAFDPSGKEYGKYEQKDEDGFTQLMGMVAPAVAGWGFGGALSGMFGGGVTGTALGQGITNGSLSAMQGGDFGKGFLGGAIGGGLQGLAAGTPAVMGNNPSAYVPATPGTSLAGAAGITNPTLAGMFNRGATGALGALASGSNGREALTSGLTGAAMSGINTVGKIGMNFLGDSLKSWLTPETTQADYSMGDTSYGSNYMAPGQSALREAGLFPEMSNVPPSSSNFQTLDTMGLPSLNENPMMNASYSSNYHPGGSIGQGLRDAGIGPQMSYAPPSETGANFGGSDFLSSFSGGAPMGQQSIQSSGQSDFSLPSIFGDAGRSVGNFALNNAGDLASMLYGFYNNRRQQKQLGQQMSTLQGLYGQNSPYAAQLRNTLNAKAAATGRRSNVAGRETQLQAMLAERASSLMPTLMQMNQQRGSLKNNNMNMLLQGANKLGLFSGLGNLFKNQNPYANYSMSQNPSDYNLLGTGRP